MDKLTIQQFGATIKQKYPQYGGFSDYEIGQKTLKKYPQYGEKVTFTYDVPEVVETKQSKLGRLQSEAQKATEEAKKATSPLGYVKNFGKALVENLMPSEVGLGKTIGKLAGNQTDTYSKLIQDVSNQQANLLKAIREKETKGGDTTSLKRIYNDNVKQLSELNKNLQEEGNLPTTGQVAGQLGGTALDVLSAGTYGKAKTAGMSTGKLAPSVSSTVSKVATATGLPELGKIAEQKASGLFTKKGATNVLKGAGLGYASDVSLGLQGIRGEDRTGGKAFIPGVGTAIGTAIPAISETTQSVKNFRDPEIKAQKLIEKRKTGLDKLDKYQPIKKAVEKGNERGIDIKKLLSETDVLSGTVDNTGTISTKGEDGAIAQYTKQFIDGNESLVSDLLKKENSAISPSLVKARLIQNVKNAGIEGKALTNALKSIDEEMAGYMLRANENGTIPVSTLHDAKINKYNNINFFTEGATKQYDKTVANALKKLVEENTKSVDVQKINEELSKHFAVIDYLNKLDNKKVDGGKLGKYFAQTVGAIVGSHAGPVGAVVGAEVGGRIKGGLMSKSFNGKTGKIPQQSEVINEALRVKNATPLELPYSSNNFGNRQINQAITPTATNNSITSSIPQSTPKVNTPTFENIFNDVKNNITMAKNIVTNPTQYGKSSLNATERLKVLSHIKDDAITGITEMGKEIPEALKNLQITSLDTPYNVGQKVLKILKGIK